jgi:ABC-type siderophore export system fused ATPase/permease subunit
MLLGAVVFIAPNFSGTLAGSSISKATTALLFVVGACFGLVQSIPMLVNANAAANRIDGLETELAAASETQFRTAAAPIGFQKIEVHKIVFRYVDKLSDTIF